MRADHFCPEFPDTADEIAEIAAQGTVTLVIRAKATEPGDMKLTFEIRSAENAEPVTVSETTIVNP